MTRSTINDEVSRETKSSEQLTGICTTICEKQKNPQTERETLTLTLFAGFLSLSGRHILT